MVADAPCAGAQGDLEEGMAIENDDDGDEHSEREGVVGRGFMGFVEGVRFHEFLLVVFESFLLGWGEDGEFGGFFFLVVGDSGALEVGEFVFPFGWEIIVVLEVWEGAFSTKRPCQMVVVRDEYHVIGVDSSEGSQTVTHNSKKSHKHVIDDVD